MALSQVLISAVWTQVQCRVIKLSCSCADADLPQLWAQRLSVMWWHVGNITPVTHAPSHTYTHRHWTHQGHLIFLSCQRWSWCVQLTVYWTAALPPRLQTLMSLAVLVLQSQMLWLLTVIFHGGPLTEIMSERFLHEKQLGNNLVWSPDWVVFILPLPQQDSESFKKLNFISKDEFDNLTPKVPVDPNQEVPPPPMAGRFISVSVFSVFWT